MLGLAACSGASKKIEVAKDGVVRCVKADAGPLLALTGELVADVIGSVLHVHAIDWDALRAKAKAHGADLGGCAFVAIYKAINDAEPASAMRSLQVGINPARAALDGLRADLGVGRWELADGTVL